ncbi:excinuclease ABC subunit UvrA [Zobellia galactanivorans]|uniref:excinuclease ABC subunit UvrA n=1 Tax=Zobellia galactanivorans (strain DSM 12802 / CCUG 47099 / CIP 106680 / NCIMB 13871 / Dsij) TaxID=63186 RepID=UPI0026E47F8F|nr:excinuclease ABC subunit UvrA [Zobellia galactanivorans]MDO6808967.1 excinuclease ABC subunit UvrA [Zobellia galactanivorans]
MINYEENIEVQGARVHNLKNIDVTIPREKLVVITGLSGSGKSSLAFDTIYAEGQRRYIETFSAYARQFLGGLERPDVDKIDGLSPVIAIEQKTTSKSPRSTVGTITEIYDFLRLLFARAGDAYSYNTGEKMVSYSDDQIKELIKKDYNGKKINVLAPVIKSRKGHYRELFEQIAKQGFVKVRIDGEVKDIVKGMKVDRYKTHDIEIVIDRLKVSDTEDMDKRLSETINTAMYSGENVLMVLEEGQTVARYFSRDLMCPTTGISYPVPEPNTFSFNSPKGMCPNCNGLGHVYEVNEKKIFPNKKLSVKSGGIAPLGEYKKSWAFKQIETIGQRYNFELTDPISSISEEAIDVLLNGGHETFEVDSKTLGVKRSYKIDYEGIANFIKSQYEEAGTTAIKRWAKEYMDKITCPECEGARLRKESLYFKIDEKNIAELAHLDIAELAEFFKGLEKKLEGNQLKIAEEIIKEIKTRIQFLLDVGLDYLSLNRSSKSLSGGEAQRIRLATQIGSQLVGVLYILDEPSIGLHQRDNTRLIKSLEALRDIGNSVIVVEHDRDMIECADHVIDIGPRAGKHGGEIISQGHPDELKNENTLTADYITGKREIAVPKKRRKGNGKKITLSGSTGNNLKNVTVSFPLGQMIGVTGVSGSGKSTLINETLYPIMNAHYFNGVKKPMPYKKITGLEHIDKVIDINQSPIGRTPRSNPATYTGVFGEIRSLFAKTPEAAIRGYKPGRFSFNVKGGRCETCQGGGLRVIEMNFLPDVYVECETCNGKRFNRETLEIRYKGKSIADVLEMTINEAVDFFELIPKIYRKLKTIQDVGLGYISLGQQSTTLSGGEAQRIKLATELSKRDTGNTFYILDEPTTGLHFEDIRVLMEVLTRLVDKGNTILVIEHNMDVIKMVDYIIDIGYEGGRGGGKVVAQGTPEEVAQDKKSYTAKYLRPELNIPD